MPISCFKNNSWTKPLSRSSWFVYNYTNKTPSVIYHYKSQLEKLSQYGFCGSSLPTNFHLSVLYFSTIINLSNNHYQLHTRYIFVQTLIIRRNIVYQCTFCSHSVEISQDWHEELRRFATVVLINLLNESCARDL